jgi:hypothetical protein
MDKKKPKEIIHVCNKLSTENHMEYMHTPIEYIHFKQNVK